MPAQSYLPYTYLIGWTQYNKWYYGVRWKNISEKRHPEDDLWHHYFTTSKKVPLARTILGEPDVIQIRRKFNSVKEAQDWEHKVLRRMKAAHRFEWLNQTDNKAIPVTEEIRKKLSLCNRGVNNASTTLTEEQVIELYHAVGPMKDLEKKYDNVTGGQIRCIKRKESFRNITKNITEMPGMTGGRKPYQILPVDIIKKAYLETGTFEYFFEKYNMTYSVINNIKTRKTYLNDTKNLGEPGEITKKYQNRKNPHKSTLSGKITHKSKHKSLEEIWNQFQINRTDITHLDYSHLDPSITRPRQIVFHLLEGTAKPPKCSECDNDTKFHKHNYSETCCATECITKRKRKNKLLRKG